MLPLLGPIFAKEAVEIARRPRYYFNRVLYGAALLLALLIVWENHANRFSGTMSIHAMARVAGALFSAVSIVQFGAVFLFVPLFLCGVLASEREEHTLELLFTTRLSDRQIVLGKLFSRLAALAVLVLCGLPVLSLVMLWGGIDPQGLWRTTATTLLAALFVGAHAIYFSAITKSPLGALVRTYWWLAVELLAIPAAILLVLMATTPNARHPAALVFFTTLMLTNPVALFVAAAEGSVYNSIALFAGEWFFPCGFLLPAGGSLFLIWRAVRRVRHEPVPFRLPFARSRPVRFVAALWERLRHPFGRRPTSVGWARNPLWVRARRARVYDREGHIGRIQTAGWLTALAFIILLAFSEPRALTHNGGVVFGGFAWGGVLLLAALFAGGGLAGDRRRGFLDMVLTTPLSGREILDGSLLAAWEHLRRLYWLPLVLAAFFCVTGASHPVGAVCSVVTATLFLAVVLLHGVGGSLAARTRAGALIAAVVLPLLTIVGTALFMALFRRAHGPALWLLSIVFFAGAWWWRRRGIGAATVCCWLAAMYLLTACLTTFWTFGGPYSEFPGAAMHPGFLTLVMMDRNFEREFGRLWPMVVGSYWVALAVHFLLARWWLIRHFDQLVGRAAPYQRPIRWVRKPRTNAVNASAAKQEVTP